MCKQFKIRNHCRYWKDNTGSPDSGCPNIISMEPDFDGRDHAGPERCNIWKGWSILMSRGESPPPLQYPHEPPEIFYRDCHSSMTCDDCDWRDPVIPPPNWRPKNKDPSPPYSPPDSYGADQAERNWRGRQQKKEYRDSTKAAAGSSSGGSKTE